MTLIGDTTLVKVVRVFDAHTSSHLDALRQPLRSRSRAGDSQRAGQVRDAGAARA